jgi:hypothetical protein
MDPLFVWDVVVRKDMGAVLGEVHTYVGRGWWVASVRPNGVILGGHLGERAWVGTSRLA